MHSPPNAWIECASGGSVPVQGGLEFGRDEECSIRVHSPKVSRHHAVIHSKEFIFRMRPTAPERTPSTSSDSTVCEARSEPGWLLVSDIVDSTVLVQKMAMDQLATTPASWLRACTTVI